MTGNLEKTPVFRHASFNYRVQDLNATIPSLSENTQTEIHNHIIQMLKGNQLKLKVSILKLINR